MNRCVAGLVLATLLAPPTAAQVIPTGSPTADLLLARTLAEQRVFLSCSALDPPLNSRIRVDWDQNVADAVTVLTANQVAPDAIAAFTSAARPENLMPGPDTPWIEVQSLCATQPDWQTRYANRIATRLAEKLPQAFR